MNPTFVSRMLQSLAESTSGFSTGRRSPEAAGGTCVHSLRSSLLKQEEDGDDGEKALALSGQRDRGGRVGWGGRRSFLSTFGYGSGTASIYLSPKPTFLAAEKFSFQSPARPSCVRASARAASRGCGAGRDTGARHAARSHRRSAAGENLERETCLSLRWGLATSCLSACRRSTDNNLGTFFILYLNLDLFV